MVRKNVFRRGIAAALIAAFSLQVMPPAYDTVQAAGETYYYGDLDGNGHWNIYDLVAMKNGYTNPDQLTELQRAVADVSGNGVFDTEDIQLMQDYLLARMDGFPSGLICEGPEESELYDGQLTLSGSRMMEKLDRGVAAVNTGSGVFVSWRLLASDESDIGFNVYRTTDGVTEKVNSEVLYGGTNFTDTTADITKENTYFVKTVYSGAEWETDGSFTMPANKGAGAYFTVPIKDGGTIHFVWVGDFNGDGAYDYLLDRCVDDHQKLEAYLSDGTYLWSVDLGYNSENKNNISPGASTIDVGMWDGATVYDMDCDGYADVLLRIADGVTFADGTVYSNSVTNGQAIAVIDGQSGTLKATAPVPDDYIDIGPLACMMEIGYLDGETPSLVCWLKNRNSDKSFNSLMVAYGYGGTDTFSMQWKYDATKYGGGGEAHQIRVTDVDYDGKDEVLHMGYALNSDGTLRYQVPELVHGDRWYVGSFCNANNGTEMYGYGIQQNNGSGLLEYFYNASTGEILWTNYAEEGTADVARGNIGDLDPNYDGLECWSFQGMYAMDGTKITDNTPYPVFRLFWDGDLLSESYNDGKIENWNYETQATERAATTWKIYGASGSDRGVGMLHADIIGDWREESVLVNYDTDELVIYTTDIATDERIYCLAQNPCYRNCMTAKGYYQANMLDYFLGEGMEATTTPDICIIGEAAVDESAVYAIRNANSGRCMDVYKSGTADGTNVQQYSTVASKANNTWTFKEAGDGYYYIISQLSNGTTAYLEVADGADADGANVQIGTLDGTDSQKFMLKRNADGSYLILTKCSGETKCVEVIDANTEAGANVQQWTVNGHACQSWAFEKIS
ncbi:MAG: RICIN domain-containing protein [Ruminococcus sp.]|nr:RICIN domain-containing protein [Ruminococcus sp.]